MSQRDFQDLYWPNYDNVAIRELLLNWIPFVAKLREIVPPDEKLLQSITDQLCPPIISSDVRQTFYFPDRELIRSFGQVAHDLGAIELRKDGTKAWVRPILQSALIRVPIKFSLPLSELPDKLQANLQSLSEMFHMNDATDRDHTVNIRTIAATLSKPMKTVLAIALALDHIPSPQLEE